MRTRALSLSLSLALLALAPSAMAQTSPQDAVGSVLGAVNGALGNSPGSAPSSSRRASSRSRRPAARPPSPLGLPLGGNAPRQLLMVQADGYMNLPLETFLTTRQVRPPPFDWSGSGCRFGEVSGPFRDSFSRACARHDFGYRNYGAGGLALDTNEARRTRIDDRLRDDLNGLCRSDHAGLQETPCVAAAQVLYASARATGRSWFFSNAAPPPSIPTPALPGVHDGTNNGPLPGVPIPMGGGTQGGGVPIPGLGGGGNNGLPIPGAGGGNGLPIPGAGNGLPNPTQILGGGR